MAWARGTLAATLYVARPGAYAEAHHSQWAINGLKEVSQAFGRAPQWEVIDDDVPKRFRSWKRSTTLFLFTHAFGRMSPIRCGDTGKPIPSYLLPLPERLREQIYFWAREYVDFDRIWLKSGALEIPAYKELADPNSQFSREGRELCAQLESATTTPTYYLLLRYWGRKEGEASRPCPGCGGRWHAPAPSMKKAPFHRFHFRCKKCRLVSYCSSSEDDERHARIGEFRERDIRSKRGSDKNHLS